MGTGLLVPRCMKPPGLFRIILALSSYSLQNLDRRSKLFEKRNCTGVFCLLDCRESICSSMPSFCEETSTCSLYEITLLLLRRGENGVPTRADILRVVHL